MFHIFLIIATILLHLAPVDADCTGNNVLRALRRYSDQAVPFCSDYITQTVSPIATEVDVSTESTTTTIFTTTVLKSSSTLITTTSTPITTTTLSQMIVVDKRTAVPLPTYVSQYSPAQVNSACSCLIGPLSTTTMSISTTKVKTVSGKTTTTSTETVVSTVSGTETSTSIAPYPTDCPAADNSIYVSSGGVTFHRYCAAVPNSYTHADFVNDISTLDECIEACAIRGDCAAAVIERDPGFPPRCLVYSGNPTGINFYTPDDTALRVSGSQ
jgi:hypothetical protein